MNKIKKIFAGAIISFFLILFSVNTVMAADGLLPKKPDKLPNVKIETVVKTATGLIFSVGEIAFVIVLLIGGVMFITSAGNEQQAEKAKKLLLYAIIGIVILTSAWGIAEFILGKLGA